MKSVSGALAVGAIIVALGLAGGSASGVDPLVEPPLAEPGQLTVLAPLDSAAAPQPTVAGLNAALSKALSDPAVGPAPGAIVYDAITGAMLFEQQGSAPATPASTNKLVTSAAVLTAYGPDHRIATRVVKGAKPSQIILVGGGDPLLRVTKPANTERQDASLAGLARQTATAIGMADSGVTQPVEVRFDDSLFSGPGTSPTWPASYAMSNTTALMADHGYSGKPGKKDPSRSAANFFAQMLATNGIAIVGKTDRQDPAADAAEVARVTSVPLSLSVQHTLERSDNEAAEVLAHLAGVKLGGGGSFSGGAAASVKVLRDLGIPTSGVTLFDGSGLSRQNLIPPEVLGKLMVDVATNARPQLWAVGTGTPVAGFSGTLENRFATPSLLPARGAVRAKTGTLTGVSGLSGLVTTKDGALLAFAFMAPRAKNYSTAEDAWDRAAANLAKCGCR